MGKNVVILAQWGDEGKGKIVDSFTDKASLVARFQGGHNAGHTLVIDGEKTLHLYPQEFCGACDLCNWQCIVLAPDTSLKEIKIGRAWRKSARSLKGVWILPIDFELSYCSRSGA